MIVKAIKSIKFPNSNGDWVTASVIGFGTCQDV